jgi:hypothetical protein
LKSAVLFNQLITSIGNFLFLSIAAQTLSLGNFFSLSITYSIYIVIISVIYHALFYRINFFNHHSKHNEALNRLQKLLLILVSSWVIFFIAGIGLEAYMVYSFLIIEIFRRNLIQADFIKKSIFFSSSFQLIRILSIFFIAPSNFQELCIIIFFVSLPFLIFITYHLWVPSYKPRKSSIGLSDLYLAISSSMGVLQFYLPIFTSSLILSKELAAAVISVRLVTNVINIFAEIIEYGFKQFFDPLQKFFKAQKKTAISVTSLFFIFSCICVYFVTDLGLTIFFPKTVLFIDSVNFSFIAIIFWSSQLIHVFARVFYFDVSSKNEFVYPLILNIVILLFTALYLIILIIFPTEIKVYLWAFSYGVTSLLLFFGFLYFIKKNK